MKAQNRNRRTNRKLTFDGKTLCVAEWAETLKMPAARILARLDKLGWSVTRALTTPRLKNQYE